MTNNIIGNEKHKYALLVDTYKVINYLTNLTFPSEEVGESLDKFGVAYVHWTIFTTTITAVTPGYSMAANL